MSLTDIQKEIRSLAQMPSGWEYGHGERMHPLAVAGADLVARLFDSLSADVIEVFPGRDGSILVTADKSSDGIEVQCFADGSFDFCYEQDGWRSEITAGLSYAQVQNKIGEVGWKSLRLYASCIRSISASAKGVFSGQHFKIHPMVAGFPSSGQNVFRPAGLIFVDTSQSSIQNESLATHRSSGAYKRMRSAKEVA